MAVSLKLEHKQPIVCVTMSVSLKLNVTSVISIVAGFPDLISVHLIPNSNLV
jgi:hypothetical protein